MPAMPSFSKNSVCLKAVVAGVVSDAFVSLPFQRRSIRLSFVVTSFDFCPGILKQNAEFEDHRSGSGIPIQAKSPIRSN